MPRARTCSARSSSARSTSSPSPARELHARAAEHRAGAVQKIGMVRRLQTVRLRDRALALQRVGRPSATTEPGVGRSAALRGRDRGLDRRAAGGAAAAGRGAAHAAGVAGDRAAHARPLHPRVRRAARPIVGVPARGRGRGRHAAEAGTAYVAPGLGHLELELLGGRRGAPRVRIPRRPLASRSSPRRPISLFSLVRDDFGARMCAVILTGMGSDGREGPRRRARRGRAVLVEDPLRRSCPGCRSRRSRPGVADEVASIDGLAAERALRTRLGRALNTLAVSRATVRAGQSSGRASGCGTLRMLR